MFRIIDLKTRETLSEFVNRDGLLSGVEQLQAKHKSAQTELAIILQQLHQAQPEGEIDVLDETSVYLPFEGYVEEVLANFGHKTATNPKGVGPLLKRSLSGVKQIASLIAKSFKRATQGLVSRSKAVLRRFKKDNRTLPEQETSSLPYEPAHLHSQSVRPLQPSTEPSLYNQPFSAEEASVEEVKLSVEPEPVPSPKEPAEPVSSDPQPYPEALVDAEPRDIQSLSTYDLQQEFIERIEQENAQIDREIFALEQKRQEHNLLLSTLKQLRLE